jgi:adenine phosphoribosyltransferase
MSPVAKTRKAGGTHAPSRKGRKAVASKPAASRAPTPKGKRKAVAAATSPVITAFDSSLEHALVVDRGGYPYLVHPLLDGVPRCPPELLQTWVAWARRQAPAREATLLLAPEAMGLPLVAPLAIALGIPYAVIRKRKYGLPGEQIAYAETGYGEAALHINDVAPGDKVLVVDDVLSTGGTLGSILSTLAGMGVAVVGALVAIDKGRWRAGLEERHRIPIHAMRTIRIESGKVRITART